MSAIPGALLYVAINFVLYTTVLRRVKWFATESGIFLYQFISFLALPFVHYALFRPSSDPFAAHAAALSLHGIYSLSFLELWSLSEGSYSLNMLDRIDQLGSLPADVENEEFERIGAAKKSARITTLESLRLIRLRDGRYTLTTFARLPVGLLRFLVGIVNIKGRIG
jgi:hypothetical protein